MPPPHHTPGQPVRRSSQAITESYSLVEPGERQRARVETHPQAKATPLLWQRALQTLERMAFTYMLRCSDGSFYVGSTTSLEARVHQHQLGLGARYTSTRLPVELVWFEEFENVGAAFAREKQIQNWSRAKRLALIEQRYADLPALAERRSKARRRERDSQDP